MVAYMSTGKTQVPLSKIVSGTFYYHFAANSKPAKIDTRYPAHLF